MHSTDPIATSCTPAEILWSMLERACVRAPMHAFVCQWRGKGVNDGRGVDPRPPT